MKDYTEMQQMISAHFDPTRPEISMEGCKVSIRNFQFRSEFRKKHHWKDLLPASLSNHELLGTSYPENDQFWYPVFVPEKNRKPDEAILLLHGLNERSWDKYFSWAYYLAEHRFSHEPFSTKVDQSKGNEFCGKRTQNQFS